MQPNIQEDKMNLILTEYHDKEYDVNDQFFLVLGSTLWRINEKQKIYQTYDARSNSWSNMNWLEDKLEYEVECAKRLGQPLSHEKAIKTKKSLRNEYLERVKNSMYNLDRFIEAQETNYTIALDEIKQGFKSSHWMWFIFPQLGSLGSSYNSKFYGIKCLKEAQQYLKHPILGTRLREICKELLNHKEKSACEILGEIDALKLKSSMTLFDLVSPNDIFNEVLLAFYNGIKDKKTMDLLGL